MVGRARSRVSPRIHPRDIIYSRDALAERNMTKEPSTMMGSLLVIIYDAKMSRLFVYFSKQSACVESTTPWNKQITREPRIQCSLRREVLHGKLVLYKFCFDWNCIVLLTNTSGLNLCERGDFFFSKKTKKRKKERKKRKLDWLCRK